MPVLSKMTSVTRDRRVKASALSGNTPSFDNRPFAAASAAGMANDNAHGQLTTKTASITSNARSGAWMRHNTYTAHAAITSATTNHAAILSANSASFGRCACARSTNAVSCEIRVAVPVCVTLSRAGASAHIEPASTASPAALRTGADSPVSRLSENAALSSNNTPSAGTTSPVDTATMSSVFNCHHSTSILKIFRC